MNTKSESQISNEEYENACKSRGYVKFRGNDLVYTKFNGKGYIEVCEYVEKEGYVNVFTDLIIVRDRNGNGLFIVSTASNICKAYTFEKLNKLLNECDYKFKNLYIQMQNEHIEEMFK